MTPTGPARPRVLVLAEAANPEWVSVPLVGWSLAAALREVADVHLVTQVRNREAILRQGWREGDDFTAIDSEKVAAPAHRLADRLRGGSGKGWTTRQAIEALTYRYFERLVWKRFGPEIRAGAYDLVHRVTPLSPTVSSPVARRCARAGVPFVMGPLNGGVPWPRAFLSERLREREWLSFLRSAYKAMPGRTATLGAASAVIAGSLHTLSEIPARFRDKAVWLPENAVDPGRFPEPAAKDGPLRACFIARLVPYKGCDMALEAAAPLLASGHLHFDILGDGPERARLEAQAEALGVADRVTFHGWVPHEEVAQRIAPCQLFLFPSIREFGGGVVLEAMAMGLVPVICDYAGPGELVPEGLGAKIPMGTRAEIVRGLTEALHALAADPAALPRQAAAARALVLDHFTWSRKARQVRTIYDWVRAPQGPAPAPLQRPATP